MSTKRRQSLDAHTIPLLALPSLPFEERRRLPKCAAIYFVLNADGTVLYIGQSINLAVRWLAHHRATRLLDKQATRIAWLAIEDETILDDIESACIAYFDPICNGYREPMPAHERVSVNVKTARTIRDQLLGALRMEGITMQDFFDDLMHTLVLHPEHLDTIKTWLATNDTTPTPAP